MKVSIIWGGDFNCSMTQLDICGGNYKPKLRSISVINSYLEEFDLVDIWRLRNPDAQKFTWRTYNPLVKRRLDYFFVSSAVQPFVSSVSIHSAPSTDHSAITLSLKSFDKNKIGPSHWRFNSALLKDPVYVQQIRFNILIWKTEYHNADDPIGLWEYIKYNIRKYTIEYSKRKRSESPKEITELEKEISSLESSIKPSDPQPIHERLEALRSELNQYYDQQIEGIILRSKVQWHEEGEKNTKYFSNLEKTNKSKTCIRKLIVNDKETTCQYDIMKYVKNYFTDKYSRKTSVTPIECCKYLDNIPLKSLGHNDAILCDGSVSKNEILHALQSMKANKSPGNDGLTSEFYSSCFDLVADFLCNSFNKSFDLGKLSASQSQAIITLLEKPGKDSRNIKSWRPISLLNVDVKLLSNTSNVKNMHPLAERLKKVISQLINPEQSAFASNRYIGESIRLISDIMNYTNNDNRDGILFAADFAAAFDSIDYIQCIYDGSP